MEKNKKKVTLVAMLPVNIEESLVKTKQVLKDSKFGQLWKFFDQKMKTMLVNQFQDEDIVEDAIQEGFTKLLVNSSSKLEQINLGWLYKTVRNKCIDEIRRRKRCNHEPEKDFEIYKEVHQELDTSIEEIESDNWRDLFKYDQLSFEDALERLKSEHEILWNVAECYYFKNLSHKEIALVFHITEDASKQRLHTAKGKLRFFLNVKNKGK